MRWTKTKPTAPGWWWCMLYHPLDGRQKPPSSMIVEVWEDGLAGGLSADVQVEAISLDDDRVVAWGDAPIQKPEGEVSA